MEEEEIIEVDVERGDLDGLYEDEVERVGVEEYLLRCCLLVGVADAIKFVVVGVDSTAVDVRDDGIVVETWLLFFFSSSKSIPTRMQATLGR